MLLIEKAAQVSADGNHIGKHIIRELSKLSLVERLEGMLRGDRHGCGFLADSR